MTQIICDVTKKVISQARRDINYFTFRNKTLSEEAKEMVEKKVRDIMKQRSPFTLKEYWATYWSTVKQMSG